MDDCTGEALGYTMEKLLKKGARDVFYTPIYMKKNRPAYKLSLICKEEDIRALEEVIFKNTSSIGIRRYKAERTILEREIVVKETKYGPVRYKVSKFGDIKISTPEYDDIKAICDKMGLGFRTVYQELLMEDLG